MLEDLYEKPIANAKCELRLGSDKFELTTDGQGMVERDIRPTDEIADRRGNVDTHCLRFFLGTLEELAIRDI